MHNQYTVAVTFRGGPTFTRDLIDVYELCRYLNDGVAWHLVSQMIVTENPKLHPES